ncbi:MAG: hypothetical protein WBD40_06720 [Tepidisphaeraceae bacterium]
MTDDSQADKRPRRPITWPFNLGLFTFLVCVVGAETMLLEPEEVARIPLDGLFETAPGLTIVGAILSVVAVVIVAVTITLAFWNRFVTDVFRVRRINVTEAVAINLVIAIFFAPT